MQLLLQQVMLLHQLLLLLLLRRGPRRRPGSRGRAGPWHLLLLLLLLREEAAWRRQRQHGLLRRAGQHLLLQLLRWRRHRWPLLLLGLPLLLLRSPDAHAVQLVELLGGLGPGRRWALAPGVSVAAVRTVDAEAQLVHVALHETEQWCQSASDLQKEVQDLTCALNRHLQSQV